MLRLNLRQVNRRQSIFEEEHAIVAVLSSPIQGEIAEHYALQEVGQATIRMEHHIKRFEQRYGYHPLTGRRVVVNS